MRRFISLFTLSFLLQPIASAMTVEEAYRAIPHESPPEDCSAEGCLFLSNQRMDVLSGLERDNTEDRRGGNPQGQGFYQVAA